MNNISTLNSCNSVIGYFNDEITIVEKDDGSLCYANVPKGLYEIGTVVNDDELFPVEFLSEQLQQDIYVFVKESVGE